MVNGILDRFAFKLLVIFWGTSIPLYKSGVLPEWLRDGSSRLLYLSSLAACIASATLSFVGALVMLHLVKSDMYTDQLKCVLPWYLLVILVCSVVNLVRMGVFAALSTNMPLLAN